MRPVADQERQDPGTNWPISSVPEMSVLDQGPLAGETTVKAPSRGPLSHLLITNT
jgi:hypothetical protein